MKHVAIIDDDHFITHIFQRQFEATGHKVSCAHSGAEACDLLKNNHPDAVVLDLSLPGMSGVEVLKYIRAREGVDTTPVVVVSNADGYSGVVMDAMDAGATHFISKDDCDVKELVEQVDYLIRHPSAHALKPSTVSCVCRNIVLADDDVVVHGVLEYFLHQAGFVVHSAYDGTEALEMIRSHPPDLMILDGQMPLLDGCEVARLAKRDPALEGVPIILMSHSRDEAMKESMLHSGVAAYMQKPFDLNHLVDQAKKLTRCG